jgi:PAS domain S-box-containing protein
MATTADAFERDLLWAWIDNAQVGLCVLDSQGIIIMVNRALTNQFMVRAPALLGFDVSALFASITTDAELLKFLKDPSDASTKEFVSEKSGLPVYFSVSVTSMPYGAGETYRVLAFTDISELRRTQSELELVARQWEAMYAGVVISDARTPDMPIVFVNSMFERMTGYSRSEVLGRNCRFLQGQDSDQPGLAAIRNAIRNKTNGYALLRNYHKNGTPLTNELFISPVRDQSGEVTHFIGVQHVRAIKRA